MLFQIAFERTSYNGELRVDGKRKNGENRESSQPRSLEVDQHIVLILQIRANTQTKFEMQKFTDDTFGVFVLCTIKVSILMI